MNNSTAVLCDCHDEPMVRYKNTRHKPGGKSMPYYWRCRVKLNEWQVSRRKLRKSSEVGYKEREFRRYRDIRLAAYGISEDDYLRMLGEQNGVCAICGTEPDTRWKMLAVDHDHDTGEVRGLLCFVCNTMVGRFEKRREAVLRYLRIS